MGLIECCVCPGIFSVGHLWRRVIVLEKESRGDSSPPLFFEHRRSFGLDTGKLKECLASGRGSTEPGVVGGFWKLYIVSVVIADESL